MDSKKKKKVVRKWSGAEIGQMIDFLSENRNFEQPTAQLYYKKFLEKSKIESTWDVVKFKVRYLKTCFGKAEQWSKNTGAGILAEDVEMGTNTVNAKLNKICPNYDRLKDIFGAKRNAEMDMFDSDLDSSAFFGFANEEESGDQINETPNQTLPEINIDLTETENSQPDIPLNNTPSQPIATKVSTFANKLKRNAPKDAITQLTMSQSDRNDTQRLKLKFSEEKFQKELEFQKEKFKAELEIRQQELQLKQKEIEKDEKLKALEIQKNERLEKYELELKYKNK